MTRPARCACRVRRDHLSIALGILHVEGLPDPTGATNIPATLNDETKVPAAFRSAVSPIEPAGGMTLRRGGDMCPNAASPASGDGTE
jgi:hypothetical protein